jgi:hypothetical protein
LLSFRDVHRLHMDAVRRAIQLYRPDADIAVIQHGSLDIAVEWFEPDLVVGEPPVPENPGEEVPVCIELSIDPARPSRFRVGQKRWESLNPGLAELFAAIDEAEKLDRDSPS